jgi:hypothetical protein
VKTNQLGATQWSMDYGFDQSGSNYLNKTNSVIQHGGCYVMTGFVETQFDTSLYLIKANHIGETGCKESETPLQADPDTDTPVINDLSLNVSNFIPDISGLSLTFFSPVASVYTFCETLTGYDRQVERNGVFPNPVKDFLHVTGFSDAARYRLENALGMKIGSGSHTVIDFRSYPSGIYFLMIVDGETCKTYKVLRTE